MGEEKTTRAKRSTGAVGEPLSLEDVAMVLGEVSLPDATFRRLRRTVRSDPRLAAPVEQLEKMARDAGLDPRQDESLWYAFRTRELLERLLTDLGWRHPGEVLDVENELEIYLDELIALTAVRVRKARDGRRPKAVLEKLERVRAEAEGRKALVEELVERLLGYESEVADRLLLQAGREHRDRRQPAREAAS